MTTETRQQAIARIKKEATERGWSRDLCKELLTIVTELEAQLAYAEADRIAIAQIRDKKATEARHRYEKAEAKIAELQKYILQSDHLIMGDTPQEEDES